MEGRLTRKKKDPILPLKKSGNYMEAGRAQLFEEHLRILLERHPEHFRALHVLVEGRQEEVSKQQLRDLRQWAYLAKDYSPLPGVTAVMKAAYRATPDGPCIVDPLDAKSSADDEARKQFEQLNEQMREQGTKRLLRRLEERRDQGRGKS
jgi:hypothetical protein